MKLDNPNTNTNTNTNDTHFHSLARPTRTEVCRTNAIIHPRAVMIHPAYAPIAYPAVMRPGRFVGLAMRTHGVRCHATLYQCGSRNSSIGYGTRVREGRLGMTRQRHGAYGAVYHGHAVGKSIGLCQCGDGEAGVEH